MTKLKWRTELYQANLKPCWDLHTLSISVSSQCQRFEFRGKPCRLLVEFMWSYYLCLMCAGAICRVYRHQKIYVVFSMCSVLCFYTGFSQELSVIRSNCTNKLSTSRYFFLFPLCLVPSVSSFLLLLTATH